MEGKRKSRVEKVQKERKGETENSVQRVIGERKTNFFF
jgi:hypothetical protein